jgi:hypothetical protein
LDIGGLRMHVAQAGIGEPLVMLHGWPQHWYEFRHLIRVLQEWGSIIGFMLCLDAPDRVVLHGARRRPPVADCRPAGVWAFRRFWWGAGADDRRPLSARAADHANAVPAWRRGWLDRPGPRPSRPAQCARHHGRAAPGRWSLRAEETPGIVISRAIEFFG